MSERLRDALTVVGQTEPIARDVSPARLIVRGVVISASLRPEHGTTLRASVTGCRGSAWMDLRWDRDPSDHDHAELAQEIVEGIQLVMREVPIGLADIDHDENAARAFLYSVAYLAIAGWQPASEFPKARARARGFRPATAAVRGIG